MAKISYQSRHKIRVVTAASLFDGHDAAINIMRRLIQAGGAEVVHLGHNRAAHEIVHAAIQEDAQAIAVSSYQGGHVEFFKYMRDLLSESGAGHIRIFGGGGGVIVPRESAELEAYGISRIFSPEDGRRVGLEGIIEELLKAADFSTLGAAPIEGVTGLGTRDWGTLARLITTAETAEEAPREARDALAAVLETSKIHPAPILGVTGTGGAGKSSLTDELVRRFLVDFPERRVAILTVDPTKKKTGGALLGDRIRFNAIDTDRVYFRSMATRGSGTELSRATAQATAILQAAGFDLVVVETSGIGQAESAVAELADLTLYVMTQEFGAPTQLEKIDMLDFADLVAINKFERRGSEDALREVRRVLRRQDRFGFDLPDEALPVYGTIAAKFNDAGVNGLYLALLGKLSEATECAYPSRIEGLPHEHRSEIAHIIPPHRARYLSEISETCRSYRAKTESQAEVASRLWRLRGACEELAAGDEDTGALQRAIEDLDGCLDDESRQLIDQWPALRDAYRGEELVVRVRDREIRSALKRETLSGTKIPRVAVPNPSDWGDLLRWRRLENLPGHFPFTAGVFPFKREGEDPKRQFAGEGPPERTNARFHFLTKDDAAKRLSTAFDSVTLYGEDPDERPDIYGKVGESGVSIATLEDMKKLYAGFDLLDPMTSVSMTINGPAPILLAMFMNTAFDRQADKFAREHGRAPTAEEMEEIRDRVLAEVRGTVQADILKEDQAQNTCIFSTEFALRMMADIQAYFIEKRVRNYYSVSISGYHIAEAGANPITQLALTLSNGFTYVESYLARGMKIDDFAPNLSFFFSNGMDAEYSVLGRVARRVWAVAMREKYGAAERSQKLKYHIQTSGRSLHAQEIQFNDIRTTLQALTAYYDHCNSLHTNAYDEAVTTPTEESVRRAQAIQLIIAREFGPARNENPMQGSYLVDELTDLVEEAVLAEFDRLSERGGVLGAMETQYQRAKIQEESMRYELRKNSGELPIVGVNTFLNPHVEEYDTSDLELRRAAPEEKDGQIAALRDFQRRHASEAPDALRRLQEVALSGGNLFAELLRTVRVASLGQISRALYEVGGRYRRNM